MKRDTLYVDHDDSQHLVAFVASFEDDFTYVPSPSNYGLRPVNLGSRSPHTPRQ